MVPSRMRARRPRSRVGLARNLVAANRHPSTVTPLHGAANLPCGVRCGAGLCGRDARAPGWVSPETCRCQALVDHAGGEPDAMAAPGWVGLARNLVAASRHPSTVTPLHGAANLPCGVRCHRARSYAGETPALPGGSRSKPCRCKQALVHDHSLARCGEPALRDSLPWCQVECGRDARAPGWVSPETLSLQAGTRPRSLLCPVRRTCPAGFVAIVPGRMRARRPRSRVGLARNRSRHSSTITPLHGAANLPCGIRFHGAESYAGETPALPGGSRPKPCRCKQAPVHGHSLARCGEPALRDSLPWCQVECGRDARAPGWVSPETLSLQAGTRPRSRPCTERRTCPAGFVAMVPGRMRAGRPRSRVGLARNLVAASRHPSTVTPLHGAANLPCGVRCHGAGSYAGGTPALPGGPRPKPCRCKQAPVHDHAFARSGEPALRDSLPWCRVECGRDARAPGWVCSHHSCSSRRHAPACRAAVLPMRQSRLASWPFVVLRG